MCRYYLGDEINYDNVFFPQAFNQDLLENHFRNLRDAGDCRNPNAYLARFAASTGTCVRAMNSVGYRSRENCAGLPADFDELTTPLAKRPKK
jgi:hypothetical protein